MVSSHTADSKPLKQEVNGIVILPPLVFPGTGFTYDCQNLFIVQATGVGFVIMWKKASFSSKMGCREY